MGLSARAEATRAKVLPNLTYRETETWAVAAEDQLRQHLLRFIETDSGLVLTAEIRWAMECTCIFIAGTLSKLIDDPSQRQLVESVAFKTHRILALLELEPEP